MKRIGLVLALLVSLAVIGCVTPKPSPSDRFPRTAEGEKQCTSEGVEVALNLRKSGEISVGDFPKFTVGIAYVCEGNSNEIQSVIIYGSILAALAGVHVEVIIAAAESIYAETYKISNIPYEAIMEK